MPSFNAYQHIIVGVDLTDDCACVINHAYGIATLCGAKLSLAHVLEPLTFAYGGDMPVDLTGIQEQQTERAQAELARFAKELDVNIHQQHVLVGQPAAELQYLASQEDADLIVVGSHGRKWLSLFIGSTSSNVVQAAPCDVLAVSVKRAQQ